MTIIHESFRFFAIACGLALGACGGGGSRIESRPCPPSGTSLSYASFGKEFIDRWCIRCHGSGSDESHVTLATPSDIQTHRAIVFRQAADDNESMPIGPDGPSAEERHKLGEWLACGAP